MWAYRKTGDSLSKHDERGFVTVTMISSGEAAKLKGFYWKFGVAFLAIAVAFLSK